MKYIRTLDGVYTKKYFEDCQNAQPGVAAYLFSRVVKSSDTIEELCDEIVRVCQPNTKNEWHFVLDSKDSQFLIGNEHIDYGAIWTNKGLIYVAKMIIVKKCSATIRNYSH